MADAVQIVRKKWLALEAFLDEPGKRRWCATEADALGRGGIVIVHQATGVAKSTIGAGKRELKSGVQKLDQRQRRPGGGRPRLEEKDEGLVPALEALIEPLSRGDPESPLRWTLKSTRRLARELTAQGHRCSAQKVDELLHSLGYSLKGTSKTIEGSSHPDRNAQFELINKSTTEAVASGIPVISVDTKKKELVGNFANAGKEWRPKGEPIPVAVHEFPDRATGKAIPYGVYDLALNQGFVNVGVDHDTPEFAVRSIEKWWLSPMGKTRYPNAKELFVTADAGGSNNYRFKAFKAELQRFADTHQLIVHVSHFPPGTSKWNKIEHRLFCHITLNWRGKPLVSYEAIINLISSTTTSAGLVVAASLDQGAYPKGQSIPNREFKKLRITGNEFHPEWNYRVDPREPGTLVDEPTSKERPDQDVVYGRARPRSWWLEKVKQQRALGVTEAEFCERRAISLKTLRWWRRRFSRDGLLKKPNSS